MVVYMCMIGIITRFIYNLYGNLTASKCCQPGKEQCSKNLIESDINEQ